jgi:putative ABC transport system ATP-binding protein
VTQTQITPCLQAEGVTKRFTRGSTVIWAVQDLDLSLAPGELVAVTGPSLSGKTTLVELLAGWTRPDQGRVAWGSDTSGGSPPWSYLAVIPQTFALLEELSVGENILLATRIARRRRASAPERLDHLLAAMGLDRLRDRGAFEISVGERQRTMVARALLDRPPVVLADEPVAHQDPHHAEIILGLLRDAVDDGAACVIATRRPEVAELADRVVTLTH